MTMSVALPQVRDDLGSDTRFRLNRAGVLNVWQYDDQVFDFADGRLLLRGANGAGKSKTLEMLLPFALDGDKARITASAKHHTSLLWLMTDGFEGNARVGYIWVEFLRVDASGQQEAYTCGVGIRASESQRTATAWHFATHRRIGHDLDLEDAAGPLSRGRLEAALASDGQVFEKAAAYKEHVGRTLFGLDTAQYDEVLRLLYWLRQPQVGEDIDPGKLGQYLSQALPQLDEMAIRKAGDTFDELVAFGEQIERRAAAAEALTSLAEAYGIYAHAVTTQRAEHLAAVLKTEQHLRSQVRKTETALERVTTERTRAEESFDRARVDAESAATRMRALEESPEAREQRRLTEIAERASREKEEAQRAAERAKRREDEYDRKTRVLADASAQTGELVLAFADDLDETRRRHQESVPGSNMIVPLNLATAVLQRPADAEHANSDLDAAQGIIERAGVTVGIRSAAVTAVLAAMDLFNAARSQEDAAQRRADDAEERWEQARARRIESERAASNAEIDFQGTLADWAARPEAVPIELPTELTSETLDSIPELVRRVASVRLDALRAELQSESTRRDNEAGQIRLLESKRHEIEAERDPAPPLPALGRTTRPDGHALWQVIDFGQDLDEAARARLEAALQSSGLLDAWVRPGGRLLGSDLRDTLLFGLSRTTGPTLADVLRVELPTDSDLSDSDVLSVLNAIHFGNEPGPANAVAVDGTWRLGPAHGRATKELPQYIGATARAHERARRLAEIDQAIQAHREIYDAASASADLAQATVDALEGWERERPSGAPLRNTWTRLSEHFEAETRDEQANRAAQTGAQNRRREASEAHTALSRLAQEHGLPVESGPLSAVQERLQSLREALGSLGSRIPQLRRDLARWVTDARAVEEALRELTLEQGDAAAAGDRAARTQVQLEALREAVGATVHELEQKIAKTRASKEAHEQTRDEADSRVRGLAESLGEVREGLKSSKERLDSHAPTRAEALATFAELAEAPGLLAAVGVTSADPFVHARSVPGDAPVPEAVVQAAQALANRPSDDVTKAADRVWKAHTDAESGPAADHQPAMARFGDLLAVTGRDDAGEAPLVALAARVSAAVEHDRTLLTEREKKQFEQHILGELGDALRKCRRDADELVAAMNELLGGVSTSQGIRLRLKWNLREDVPAEARAAVDLLGQPVGALLPEERASLRDALHGLIETSRALNPELSYSEHLASALDYRTWSEFSIRYTRPEKPGTWERLHRRSALSQGEQKVLCYLPLFAAAAAHFTSLAGAAPHAPRLVLLDDAFPKIDVKTHPLLFGLLVQLDLDFVITSERLWGCHDSVPSLAIYEALRDPTQRGIAQYESRWDGRTLHSIG
jgi:uncharacterized protein (TIGR02680 family)